MTRNAILASLAVLFVVALDAPARADFEAGMAAYEQGDFQTALSEWRPLAEAGDARAQNLLGVMYGAGFGVARDDAIAATWFRGAAVQGDVRAQYSLGRLYRLGLGVARDPVEGARWIKRSARAGHVRAQGTLGALYARGEGVPKDLLRAYFWWTVAAADGHLESAIAREDAAGMMTPHQIRVGNLLAEGWRREPASTGP
ncbi:MAG: tetratricopeptide repeat protein [Alphaproteobacteria bacterium]